MSPLACHWNRQADVVSDSRPTHAHSAVVSGLSSEDSSRDSVSVHLCECSVDRSWLGRRGHCATRSAIRKDLKHILSPLPLTPKIQSHRLHTQVTARAAAAIPSAPIRAQHTDAPSRGVGRRVARASVSQAQLTPYGCTPLYSQLSLSPTRGRALNCCRPDASGDSDAPVSAVAKAKPNADTRARRRGPQPPGARTHCPRT